jgi:hypothetical protein
VVVILAAVAALVIIGGGVGIVIMNSRPVAVQRPLPEDTARAFVEAGYRSDCDAVRATIDEDFWERGGLTCLDVSFHGADFADTTVADWAITDTAITGDLATLTLDPPGEIPSTALHLRFVDGAWKITDWQF